MCRSYADISKSVNMSVRDILFECYIKILTETYFDNHNDNRIYTLFYVSHEFFFIFALLPVSDAHDIRLINEYCMYVPLKLILFGLVMLNMRVGKKGDKE